MPYIYKDGVIYGGGGSGGGNSNVKELTYEEYLALGDAVNDDDITYFITDKEPEGGSGGNSNVKEVTLAEYEALGEATENDDVTYFITDLVQEGGSGGSGGSVDVDYSQIEFDTTEILVTNVADDKTCCGMRYNVDTDIIQIYHNGEWKDWQTAKLKFDGTLFNNGEMPYYTFVNVGYSGTTASISNTIYLNAPTNLVAAVRTNEKINLSGFSKLNVTVDSAKEETGISIHENEVSNPQGSGILYSYKTGTGVHTIDVSSLSGEYYIYLYQQNSENCTISKVELV